MHGSPSGPRGRGRGGEGAAPGGASAPGVPSRIPTIVPNLASAQTSQGQMQGQGQGQGQGMLHAAGALQTQSQSQPRAPGGVPAPAPGGGNAQVATAPTSAAPPGPAQLVAGFGPQQLIALLSEPGPVGDFARRAVSQALSQEQAHAGKAGPGMGGGGAAWPAHPPAPVPGSSAAPSSELASTQLLHALQRQLQAAQAGPKPPQQQQVTASAAGPSGAAGTQVYSGVASSFPQQPPLPFAQGQGQPGQGQPGQGQGQAAAMQYLSQLIQQEGQLGVGGGGAGGGSDARGRQ